MAASMTANTGKIVGPELRCAWSHFFGGEGKLGVKSICQPLDEHTLSGYIAINFRIYLSWTFRNELAS